MKKIISILIFTGVFFSAMVQLGYGQKGTKTETQPLKLDIVLVLDNSGSMKKNDPKFLTREVVTNFLNGLGENARLGMVIFDQEAILAEALNHVTDPKTKAEFLKSIDDVNYKGQFTNSPAAIERAVYELKTHARKDAQKVIIFLTDGIVDTGDKSRDLEKEKWLKEDLARESKKAGIRIIGIAFTDNADFLLIQTLAIKTEGEYFRAYKAEDIQGIFKNIYDIITKPPAKAEVKTPDSKLVTPTLPPAQKTSIPLPLLIAGIIVILGVVILFVVFRGKSKEEMKVTYDQGKIQPRMPQAELIDVNSIISKQSIHLVKQNIEIGRDAKRDITILEDTVSDFHAIIEYKDGYFYLEDQRSTNGTSLNGKKIEPNKPVKLKSGDKINFDIFEFRFVLPDQGQAGKTKLAVKAPQDSGTVLRPSKKEVDKPQDAPPLQSQDIKDSSDKESEDQALQQESETRIKPGMCPNHPARKATELCMVCKNAFCKQCMTEKDGKKICINCAGKDQ